ncbi:MAG TPA: hypothetical protein VIV35_09905 [Chitinophagaceae bacterium]
MAVFWHCVQETDKDMINNQEQFFSELIIKVVDRPGLKVCRRDTKFAGSPVILFDQPKIYLADWSKVVILFFNKTYNNERNP